MTERLLQFIWQFRYFNLQQLATISGDPLQITSTGLLNANQGPDFTDARIKIADTIWAGTVELHIRTSDWHKHHHQSDPHYENVILHVVWEHDSIVNHVPVLELKNHVSKLLLQRYEELMNNTAFIPCEKNISQVKEISLRSWKDRLLAERLLRKAGIVDELLKQNNHHWEEVFWWMLARTFGMKVNAEVFEAIARSIPINILAKHKQQIHQLEALLLGQAGLLEAAFSEDYPLLLQREYRFLQDKYGLKPVAMPVHFLRMRPFNFPTVRLAQLAMLVHHSAHLFSKIKEAGSIDELNKLFDITANDYWHYHYRFDELSAFTKKRTGASMAATIIINTIAPLLFSYGTYHADVASKQKALQWLGQLKPEQNSITKGFVNAGIENKNACDSQALIELKNEYCNHKRCLDCGIGNAILKN